MTSARAIYGATFVVLAAVATLSVLGYRATERDLVDAFGAERLAVARTVAVAVETELGAMQMLLRQLRSLPSVQTLDAPSIASRIAMTFEGDATGIVREVVRVDRDRRLLAWHTTGRQLVDRVPLDLDDAWWARVSDPSFGSTAMVSRAWHRPDEPSLRQITLPVRHVSPTAATPVVPGTFEGVLGFVIDIGQVIDTFARTTSATASADVLVLEDASGGTVVRLGPVAASRDGSRLAATDAEGTLTLTDADGDDLAMAWSAFSAADERWVVRIETPLAQIAPDVQAGAVRQLWLTALVVLAVPVVAWLLVRRERRAEQERLQLQSELLQAQKMDAIGKLAGGVAHDFNNLLTAILGYTSLILERSDPGSKIHAEATQVRRAAESAASLTQKLLALSRKQVLQPERLDLGRHVRDLRSLLARLVGERVRLDVQVSEGTWPVVADPVQIEQVLINLAVNARDAMPDGGTLALTLRNLDLPDGLDRRDHQVAPGRYVQIVVRDTGTGMDEATRTRLFEPFFTTKPKGQGTGLGLPTVFGIVKQSGGYVDVTTALGAGTAVEVLLPALPALPDAAPPEATADPRPAGAGQGARGTETVLLVEDDLAVLELTQASLERAGYQVVAAAGPDEALRLAREHDGAITLLLSDVVMPGMIGPELAVHVRRLRPSIRVLFMSGYAAEAGGDLTGAALLQKPFSTAVLLRAVRLVIDAAPEPAGAGAR